MAQVRELRNQRQNPLQHRISIYLIGHADPPHKFKDGPIKIDGMVPAPSRYAGRTCAV
ncbi:hypothetical protein [Phaeobacter sp. C3_T13_0]|uniref:hypothetical protein n=1 Tax=Phaeobacter cretensis TaxID=3342641 RepID=UPI0039BCEB2D